MTGFRFGIPSKGRKYSKQEAMENGQPVFLGKQCKRGHEGFRFVHNHSCIECSRNQRVAKTYGVKAGSAISKAEKLKEDRELKKLLSGNEYDF